MADDIVRKITITATGQDIDKTTGSVKSLGEATDNTTKSASGANSSLVSLAAGVYVAKTAYDALSYASTNASSSMGAATASITSSVGAALAYVPNKINEIWQEGIDKLNAYVALSEKAGNLGVEYYQRLTKAATDANKPADDYLKAITNINAALDRNLGTNGNQNGSAFNTQVLDLQKNGNLQGQTAAVNRVNNSITGPEQLASASKLIQEATEAGEKLVAFKLTGTLMGPEAAANLKNDNDYFYQLTKSIDDVKASDLIKQVDVDRAVSMTTEFTNAQKVIDKWFEKPASDWSGLGIEIQQLWLNANNNFAATLTWLDKIFDRTNDIANIKPNPDGSIWTKIGDFFNDGSVTRLDDAGRALGIAQQTLGSQLGNKNNVTNARREAQAASDRLTPDQSSPPPAPADALKPPDASAFDRASDALDKYIQVTKAASTATDLGIGDQERLKATALLTAGALKDGLSAEAAKSKAELSDLGRQAGLAADQLAKAKINTDISRGRNTALLSPEDVQIANQLKGIYPDVATALNSVQASGLRTNAALSGVASTTSGALTDGLTSIENGSTRVGAGFKNMGVLVENALLQMINKLLIVGPLMQALQSGLSGFGGALGGAGVTYGTPGAAGSNLFGPLAPTGHASGTSNAPGGWSMVGENGPELMNVPSGATILPNGVMPGNSGGGGGNSVQVNVINNADGTKATTSKRSEGGVDIHSIIISAVDSHVASGGLDKTMKNRYATPLRSKGR